MYDIQNYCQMLILMVINNTTSNIKKDLKAYVQKQIKYIIIKSIESDCFKWKIVIVVQSINSEYFKACLAN